MAKEETNNHEGTKLTYEQLAAFTDKLQQEYQKLLKEASSMKKELDACRMSDYYTRTGLLLEIIKFENEKHCFKPSFIERITGEFEELVSPVEDKNNHSGEVKQE